MQRFIDEIQLKLKAGDGGSGCASLFRGPNLPKGGPDGGDGGNGGNVWLEASPHMTSLLDFKYKRHFSAERGLDGKSRQMNGRGGKDLTLKVPVGSLIYDQNANLLVDLCENGQRYLICKGGKGGLGNIHFKSSTNQTPRTAQPGKPGEEIIIDIELKSICDVGFVGLPNAGKSSLLKALTKANPKVGNYAFTTLHPELGVLPSDPPIHFADIPGLIKGAHLNQGLGHQFLRHIQRSKTLVVLLSFDADHSLFDQKELLIEELKTYDLQLVDKRMIYVINKIDLLSDDSLDKELKSRWMIEREEFLSLYPEGIEISALHHTHLNILIDCIKEQLGLASEAMLSSKRSSA